MDRIVKNLLVILAGAAASVVTAAALFLLGLRGGDSLLDLKGWNWVPLGMIAAGFLAGTGYFVAAQVLRVRPGVILLAGVFAISAGTHLYIRHMDVAAMMATNRAALASPKVFAKFATTSLWSTRLPDMSLGGDDKSSSSEASSSPDSTPATEGPHIDTGGDANAEGMAQGVGGMLAKADMGTQLGAGGGGKMTQMGTDIDSVGKGVAKDSGQWLASALEIFGFAFGGVVVYGMMRGLPYCPACGEFLAQKGTQTRYYLTERTLRNCVDELHARMKEHQLTESIMGHFGVGSDEKSHLSEYASTIDIKECRQCHTHRMQFSAKRKKGKNWKNIKVFGHTAESLEPIDIVRV
ncbi:MAG TPA: hypothetical protein VN612_09660 [Acidobacteriaceae bacterium]|nr:hypothetical protein [Acidobacteriaceae bacterium]